MQDACSGTIARLGDGGDGDGNTISNPEKKGESAADRTNSHPGVRRVLQPAAPRPPSAAHTVVGGEREIGWLLRLVLGAPRGPLAQDRG